MPLRRLAVLSIALASVATACGSDRIPESSKSTAAATSEPSTAAASASGLKVTGGDNDKPVVEIPSTPPPSELTVEVIRTGTGAPVQAGDNLTAHYVGLLWRDGSQFDASWDRGEPATFPIGVGAVIPGWDKGLVGQPYGSRVVLAIPPLDGYGTGGNPRAGIRGDDTLIFVVDLIEAAG
jgi:peptidylprolyl isomerase